MNAPSFRERIRSRTPLLGTFLKTASYQAVEVLGASSMDFVVVDAEHAPFGRSDLDVCHLASRASGLHSLVRIPDNAEATILNALDVGASGVLVPHVKSAEDARRVHRSSRYRGGVRGFSNSPRAGGYGRMSLLELVEQADREIVVACQIEDREAIEAIESIAAVDEVDCLFVGRADLAVSYGVLDVNHEQVIAAVERVFHVCQQADKAVGVFLADVREAARYLQLGASFFIVGSDQSLLRTQATAVATQFRSACAA